MSKARPVVMLRALDALLPYARTRAQDMAEDAQETGRECILAARAEAAVRLAEAVLAGRTGAGEIAHLVGVSAAASRISLENCGRNCGCARKPEESAAAEP